MQNAQVAKLVDALCSGRSVRKDVLVRIQSWAPKKTQLMVGSFYFNEWRNLPAVRLVVRQLADQVAALARMCPDLHRDPGHQAFGHFPKVFFAFYLTCLIKI